MAKTDKIQQWDKREPIFEGNLDSVYREIDSCDVFYIEEKGFCVLNRKPKYSIYHRFGIPEIQDVYVLPEYRGHGIATHLISYCEDVCTADMIGISVPVSPQFGAAQRLYSKLGYVPDGNGATYDRETVIHSRNYRIDENLCLMLLKTLK